jgi:hypothetical protein
MRYRDVDADPYDLVQVSPAAVTHLVSPRLQEDLPADGTYVLGGDWDRRQRGGQLYFFEGFEQQNGQRGLVSLENYVFYRSVEAHLRDGVPWPETEFYQWALEYDGFPSFTVYASEEGREWRFRQLDRLADSMREAGYRSQRELDGDAVVSGEEYVGSTVSRWVRADDVPPEFHEVMVNIGRDGEILFEEGRHRFAVARALGIDTIPVRVFVRHARWQERRQEVAEATAPSELSEGTRERLVHPDLAGLKSF